MNALHNLLTHFCQSAQSERGKGTYFEDLTLKCFAHEPKYRDLYDWAIGFVLVMFIIFLGLRMKKWLCLQVKSYKESDDFGRSFYHAIGFVLVMFIILLGIYVLKFNGNPSGQPEDFGTFGDYIGGVLNPFIAFLALLGLWQTNKKQVKMLETQIDKEEDKDAERKQQDDFNRKFDSYKDVLNQISSQMLYPWAKNEPAVSGKAALARWLEIIRSEKVENPQGGERESMLLVSYFINYSFTDSFGFYPQNQEILFIIKDPKQKVQIKSYLSEDFLNAVNAHLKTGNLPKSSANIDSNFVNLRFLNESFAQRVHYDEWIVFYKIEHWLDTFSPFFKFITENEALETYFRSVFHVLNSQVKCNELAAKNIQFFKSQLTQTELAYIGIFILFANKGIPLLDLVKQFALLEYLPKFPLADGKSNLGYIIFNESNCGEECFKEIE